MAEANLGYSLQDAWSFEPVPLYPIDLEVAPLAKITPLTRAIGNVATRLSSRDVAFNATDEKGYWKQSVLLHTPSGPVHYYRVANDNGSRLAVEYPSNVGEIPDELISSTLEVEPNLLHNDFPHKDAPQKDRKLIASWRFPEPDEKGKYTWLQQRDGTVVHFGGPYLSDTAVIDGALGHMYAPKMKSVAIEEGRYYGYVEAEPAKPNVETIHKLENRFKRFALGLAGYMGGAKQISAATQESDPRTLSYHAVGTDHNQAAAFVIPKLALRGYDVKEFQRIEGEYVDPGFKVLIATKPSPRGKETLAVYEGLSAFLYTRGGREWRVTRGLVLKDNVQLQDFDNILRPVTNKTR